MTTMTNGQRGTFFGFWMLLAATAGLLLCILHTGCASTYVARESTRELKQAKALAARDLGEGAVGIGLDVTALEALTHQPFKQLGAAVLDAGVLYGLYQGVRELADQVNHDDDSSQEAVVVERNSGPVTIQARPDTIAVRDNSGPVVLEGGR